MKKKISAILALVLATACFPVQTVVNALDTVASDSISDVTTDELEYIEPLRIKVYTHAEYEELLTAGRIVNVIDDSAEKNDKTYLLNEEGKAERIYISNINIDEFEYAPFIDNHRYTLAEYKALFYAGRAVERTVGNNVLNPDAPCDWTKRNYRTSYILNDEDEIQEIMVSDINIDELEWDFTRECPRQYTYAEYEELVADGRVLSGTLSDMGCDDWTKALYSIDIINDEGMRERILVKSRWYIEEDEEVDIEEIANKSDKTEKDIVTGISWAIDAALNGEITDEEALQLANRILKGDATEDGEVDIVDVISVNKSILGQTKLSSSAQKASDIDEDGIVSPSDSLAIMQYIVGLTEEL
ncbi:MAG: dockerin type I repeat-containing protein [Oscillospiraceae bacterium]|nr:dockerin type I repeat-containing protein [Oscillospiraceae bacterium]